ASLGGIPWETLVKVFRERLHDEKKGTIRQYAEAFFAFLEGGHPWLSPESQKTQIVIALAKNFIKIINDSKSNAEAKDIIEKEIARLQSLQDVPGFDTPFIDEIPKSYEEQIRLATEISLKDSQRKNIVNSTRDYLNCGSPSKS